VPTKSGSSASAVNRCAKPFFQARRTVSNSAGYRELDRVSRGGDVQHWYGTCFVSYMDTRKQQQALPSNSNGLDWRRPVQKELTGLFDELAAFNERIAEPSNEGPIRNPPRSPPPAYFDAQKEPLVDEYRALFDVMEAPPANAQKSATPFKDVVDLAIAIARAKGLDAANAEAAGRISLGLFFAETNGHQNVGNGRSNTYNGSFQTGPSEDQNGQKKWVAIKPAIAAFDPALILRDDKEEARAGNLDHRFNHWTAVRDALMGEHADIFPQVRAIVKTLPNPIDQMKFFELIQIIPSPIRSALKSGDLVNYRISDPRIMEYLRNNSIFAIGQADRARTSATVREILDAMWLFNSKFERAPSKFAEIKAR
jgi:hypothetical protein